MQLQTAYLQTPIGIAKISGDINGIQTVSVIDEAVTISENIPECLQDCVLQLDEYFTDKRDSFNLKLNPQGTLFQKKVWQELVKTPYGKTETYLGQATKLGDAKAVRAVAAANGKNPIWIIIPCHRIIGSNGSLTGYAGGIWRKKWLLNHENPIKQTSLF